MSAPRPVRIELALPALTPAQADLLWGFLQDLASKLWDAYESELLCEVEDLRSCPPDLEPDWTDIDGEVPFETSCTPHDPLTNHEPGSSVPLHPSPNPA